VADGEESDESLIARAGRGDAKAAGALVARHADRVYATARRMLGDAASAEDAAQETFLRLWTSASRWRPQGAKFETWLFKVATNICLDRLRKRGREVPEESAPELADRAMRADDLLIAEERRSAIEEALTRLPERQRAAITLCHYQELSNIDAAAILGVSVEALESLLARGRRTLRDALHADRADLLEVIAHDASSIAI